MPKALVVKPKLPLVNAAGILAGSALLPLPVATAGSENRELVEEAADDPLPPTAGNGLAAKGAGAGAVPKALEVEPKLKLDDEAALLAENELFPRDSATVEDEAAVGEAIEAPVAENVSSDTLLEPKGEPGAADVINGEEIRDAEDDPEKNGAALDPEDDAALDPEDDGDAEIPLLNVAFNPIRCCRILLRWSAFSATPGISTRYSFNSSSLHPTTFGPSMSLHAHATLYFSQPSTLATSAAMSSLVMSIRGFGFERKEASLGKEEALPPNPVNELAAKSEGAGTLPKEPVVGPKLKLVE